MRPLETVRKKCLWCCGNQPKVVSIYPAEVCMLHPFRFGRNPASNTKLTLKIIRAKCIDCSCYVLKGVRNCFKTECPLYPFRMGRNPNKKRGSSRKGISCQKTPSGGPKTEQSE